MLFRNLLSVVAAACTCTVVSLILQYGAGLNNTNWLYSIIYFFALCFVFNLVCAAKAGSADLTGLLIAGIVIKLLLAFVIEFLYSIFSRPDFAAFSAHFISHYILFTAFEIRYLFRIIKTKTSS